MKKLFVALAAVSLSVVALADEPAKQVWVILPIVAMPWGYAFRTYVWPSRTGPQGAVAR